jgi:hypothetical protein
MKRRPAAHAFGRRGGGPASDRYRVKGCRGVLEPIGMGASRSPGHSYIADRMPSRRMLDRFAADQALSHSLQMRLGVRREVLARFGELEHLDQFVWALETIGLACSPTRRNVLDGLRREHDGAW